MLLRHWTVKHSWQRWPGYRARRRSLVRVYVRVRERHKVWLVCWCVLPLTTSTCCYFSVVRSPKSEVRQCMVPFTPANRGTTSTSTPTPDSRVQSTCTSQSTSSCTNTIVDNDQSAIPCALIPHDDTSFLFMCKIRGLTWKCKTGSRRLFWISYDSADGPLR